jgi:hypothetical protein
MGQVKEKGTVELRQGLAQALQENVKSVEEYREEPANQISTALRDAVSRADRKWTGMVVLKPEVVKELEKTVDVLDERLRKQRQGPRSPRPSGGRVSPAPPRLEEGGGDSPSTSSIRLKPQKQSCPMYDSDIDGESSETSRPGEPPIVPILREMASMDNVMLSGGGGRTERRARLEKAGKGSLSLIDQMVAPTAVGGTEQQSNVGEDKKDEMERPVYSKSDKFGELLQGLWKKKDEADEELDFEIGTPTNVEHFGHVGPTNANEDSVKSLAEEILVKQKKSSNVPAQKTLRFAEAPKEEEKKEKKKSAVKKEEEEEEESFLISGPMEVSHQAHVDREEAELEAVATAIDSVKLKEREVDVENVYAADEEIVFAEEWDPNAGE